MKRLGVAVLGSGFQGRIHAENVAASTRADLIACIDVDGDRADELAADLGAGWSSTLADDVWADPAIDAVVIATTTHTHHELALQAAAHGRHMLLEKPMAISIEECREIQASAEAAGVVVVLGYKFRFTAAAVAAKQAVPDPRVLVAHTLYDPAPPGSSGWVNDRAFSGGRLVSSLVHAVDMLRFLSGAEVVRVFAEGALVAEPALGEADTTVATLLFDNGAIAAVVHGTAAASGLVSTWAFQSAGAGVNATIHDHGRRLALNRPGNEPAHTEVVDSTEDPFRAGTAPLLAALVAAIAGEGPAVPGSRDGIMSLLVSRCVEEAIATGQPVTVPAV
ncbi:MAG TPA: Gfo/Idh/MocA family oxidoreductase [Acidimicrobiia bacterium]|nr:Gfo/Idh/MocA family oxidoreductase [Acidimicrobiia bacterium]